MSGKVTALSNLAKMVFLHHSALDEFGIETVYADDIVADVTENGRGAMIKYMRNAKRQQQQQMIVNCWKMKAYS